MALNIETIPSAQRISREALVNTGSCQLLSGQTRGGMESDSESISLQEMTLDGTVISQKGCPLMTFGTTTQTMVLKYRCKTRADLG